MERKEPIPDNYGLALGRLKAISRATVEVR